MTNFRGNYQNVDPGDATPATETLIAQIYSTLTIGQIVNKGGTALNPIS